MCKQCKCSGKSQPETAIKGLDIRKYGGEVNAGRVLVVLRSIVPQFSKENEKFIYGALREGARGRDYEEAIEWLVSTVLACIFTLLVSIIKNWLCS